MCVCMEQYSWVYKWVIFLNWALKCDMETKSKNRPNNSINNIPIHIRTDVHMKVCMLFICQSWKQYISPLDLDLLHNEWYHSHKMKIRHIHNIILICTTMPNKIVLITVKQTRLYLSRTKWKRIWITVWLNVDVDV